MRIQAHTLLLAACILFTGCTRNSEKGPGNGGGGDPRVAAFLDAANFACTWLQKTSVLDDKATTCWDELADLTASVNDQKRIARVYSDSLLALDHGVEKDAVTDLSSRRVHINIQRWDLASLIERRVTATMEMALLLGIPDRYTLGKRLTAELASAETTSTAEDLMAFRDWAEKILSGSTLKSKEGYPRAVIQGQTQDQYDCALFITHLGPMITQVGVESVIYYLSLGVGPDISEDKDDRNNIYIGGFVALQDIDLKMSAHQIYFRSISLEATNVDDLGQPTDFLFSDRSLIIEKSDSGQVFRITGTTSRLKQPFVCNMTPEI